jgi:AbrB family looped-hinge helix DNA binding protein
MKSMPTQETAMALVKLLRGGQMTLPAEARKALRLKEGDYLEAEVTENRIVLKPVAVVSRDEAWHRLRQAQQAVRYVGPEPRPSPEAEEPWIFDAVEGERDGHA